MSVPNFKNPKLRNDVLGKGEIIVLVHGYPFNRSMWSAQAKLLSKAYRIIAPDLRGYGESMVTAGKVSLEDHATDIGRLLDV